MRTQHSKHSTAVFGTHGTPSLVARCLATAIGTLEAHSHRSLQTGKKSISATTLCPRPAGRIANITLGLLYSRYARCCLIAAIVSAKRITFEKLLPYPVGNAIFMPYRSRRRLFGRRRSIFVKNLPRNSFTDLRFKNRNRRCEFGDDFEGVV